MIIIFVFEVLHRLQNIFHKFSASLAALLLQKIEYFYHNLWVEMFSVVERNGFIGSGCVLIDQTDFAAVEKIYKQKLFMSFQQNGISAEKSLTNYLVVHLHRNVLDR